MSVSEEDALSKCLMLFEKKNLPALAVFNREGKHVGVLAPRWIIRSRLDPTTTNVKALMRTAPKVSLHDPLSKVARLMLESEIRKLPVYGEGKLLGFVTEEDVIYGAVAEKWGSNRVGEIMTKDPFVVTEDDSLGRVLSLFRERDISHAPLVRNGNLVGMISIRDIIEHVFQPRQSQTRGEIVGEKIKGLSIPVKGLMSKPVITVLAENQLNHAAKKMRDSNISSLVVVTNRRPTGIVTKRDFLEAISQTERAERRLSLQFSTKGVELDESQRGTMLGDFKSFARRYEEALEAGTLFVYMKRHGTNFRGNQLIHCRLQLRTIKGSFFSNSEGWNVGQTFYRALDRLERQILRSKELEYDPKYSRTYLQRTGFPITEV